MAMGAMRNGSLLGFDGGVTLAAIALGAVALLWLAPGSARADATDEGRWPPRVCGEGGRVCLHAARTDLRVCLDGCDRGEAGDSCRQECRGAFQDARTRCREGVRECVQAHLPPLDEVCAAECRDDFAATREDLRACRGDCRQDVRDALTACRQDLAGDPEGLRECVHAAHAEGRLCSQDCHDEYTCASDFRECLSGCVIDE